MKDPSQSLALEKSGKTWAKKKQQQQQNSDQHPSHVSVAPSELFPDSNGERLYFLACFTFP